MKKFRKTFAVALITLAALSNISFAYASDYAISDPALQPDLDEGCIGEVITTGDGQQYTYIFGELDVTRSNTTVYNGNVFIHDSWWTDSSAGRGAYAHTTSYSEINHEPHYHYTRVRIQDRLLPIIDEDSGRKWGLGYSEAETPQKPQYTDQLQYTMRSYWGDSTTSSD